MTCLPGRLCVVPAVNAAFPIENSRGEADFDAARRKVLVMLTPKPEEEAVTGAGNSMSSDPVAMFERLMALEHEDLLLVITVVMGETLAPDSTMIDFLARHIGMDMLPPATYIAWAGVGTIEQAACMAQAIAYGVGMKGTPDNAHVARFPSKRPGRATRSPAARPALLQEIFHG